MEAARLPPHDQTGREPVALQKGKAMEPIVFNPGDATVTVKLQNGGQITGEIDAADGVGVRLVTFAQVAGGEDIRRLTFVPWSAVASADWMTTTTAGGA